jgi:hypothetical protein
MTLGGVMERDRALWGLLSLWKLLGSMMMEEFPLRGVNGA